MQDRYRALAVLLEEMSAPVPILQALWGAKEAEVRRISRHFVERSLALRDDAGGIRLHDLQLDFVHAQYPDQEALQLIHGAMRLSAHVITRDPFQFVSQVSGRLIGFAEQNNDLSMQQFLITLAKAARHPWLRPLRRTLRMPR